MNNLGGSDLVNWNGHYISNVTIDGDNSATGINNTNYNSRYTDYTSQSTDVTAGSTYNFSINNYKGGNTWGDVKIRIWIDYDNDGNYTQVFSNNFGQNNNNTHQVTGSFVVDAAAITGTAKLRIQAAYCSSCGNGNASVLSADGCSFTNTYRGDVEDYTLNITGGSGVSEPTYCVPDQIGNWNTYYITNVAIGAINNSSTGTGGAYQNYTALEASITSGSTVTGDVTVNISSNNANERVFVWVDFNHNGQLDDAGEEFEFGIAGTGNVVVPISINVPAGSYTGKTRMRIALISDVRANFGPCRAAYASGEYEDYIMNITPASAPPEAVCQNITIELDSDGNATINPIDVDNGSSDDIAVTNYTLDIDTFDCSDIGNNTVVLTVTDAEGQTDTCIATVTVQDYSGALVPPTFADINAYCSYTVPTPADLSYGCATTITPTSSDSRTFTSSGTITWLYDDGAGHTASATQQVNIESLVSPTNIMSSAITQTTATISWDDFLGDETYSFRYRESGSLIWTTVAVSNHTINLTGLEELTEYDVQVASTCGFSESAYSTTYNFTTQINNTACVPTSNSNGTHYITNVYLPGETTTINNTSGNDGGYGDYTATQSADLFRGQSYAMELSVSNTMASENRSGWAIYIDLNGDGDIEIGEMVWDSNGEDNSLSNVNNTFNPATITIPATAVLGNVLMRVGTRRYHFSDNPCGTTSGHYEEFEDYVVNIKNDATSQDLDVSGNNINIVSGTTTTSTDNYTHYGIYDINSGAVIRTFVLENTGIADLILQSPYVSVTGAAFSVDTQPVLTTLSPGEETTFSIAFDPDSVNTFTGLVSILSNDPDENPFTFVVEGEGAQTFPDTDGDGVPDNIDIDDDNDGLTDTYESITCASYPNATTTDLVFLNETFGAGTNRIQINGNYAGATTTYCYEDGTGSCPATYNPTSVNDGDYTVHHTITNGDGVTGDINVDISDWAEDYWYTGGDHTAGDVNGRMAIFNAAEDPGIFYSQDIIGVTTGVPIQFGFYAINLDRTNAPGVSSRNKPEVTITIYDNVGNVIASETSGLIPATSPAGDWVEVSASFISTVSQFTVVLTNSQLGGQGNDLAIDDIFVKQTLCDLDGDGVADVIDLDNDNDGIPNVVELGYVDDNFDATVYNDATNVWVDANGNGMHDAYEGLTALDSDGDGVPNHIDLDSDNDGVFDNVEYNGFGDIDINGDGVGNGSDYQDTLVNATDDDQDGDGILPSIDDNDDDTDGGFDTDHGTFSYDAPIDTDGDGIPDYLDTDSNDASNDASNGTDISETIYAALDANYDGVIDGDADADADGLLDVFDTDDNNFGSPRDLDKSYSLFFDGRNDYVEDDNVISNGNATIMAWIKSEGDNTLNTNRIVAGQKYFYLVVNDSDNSVTVMLNGSAVLTSIDLVVDAIWTHVAATTNRGETVLYVNGEAQGAPLGSGEVNEDTSNFTIGRLADTDLNYFHGEIDEVRVFNSSLTETEIQRTVYQELEETENFNQGKIIPKDISENTIGANLVRYYKMDSFKDDITDDKVTPTIDQVNGAKLYNIKKIYFQTAPLPYKTIQDGLWTAQENWEHGNVWDIDVVANNKDWSIVEINNDITTVASHTNLGLLVQDTKRFTVNDDNYINNSWYIELDGTIDLLKDSQLVQTENSDLVTSETGKILRRQEGASSYYWYNYWGSPVGNTEATTLTNNNSTSNNENNTPFKINMLKDDAGDAIEFTSSNHQTGKLSSRWMYTYENGVTYYDYATLTTNTNINSGIGYIHKGVGVAQEYVFEGKPNNGTIKVSVSDVGGSGSVPGVSKTEYLFGNPYASAIDVYKFIDDNAAVLEGSIQLWQQWAGTSHVTTEYEGGYAQVNKTGSVRAYQFVGGEGENNGSQDGTKTPSRYLAVAQGFMAEIKNSGSVVFNNSQRVFIKEADADGSSSNGSVFFRTTEGVSSTSTMRKIRLEFNALDGQETRRELLLGFSDITSDDYDYGYEAKNTDDNHDDLSLLLDGEYMSIQSYGEITPDKVVPLALKTSGNNSYNIKISEIENIEEGQEIYLRDNLNDIYYDLRQDEGYTFLADEGVFNERFEIVFSNQSLSVDEVTVNNNVVLYFNSNQNLLYVKQLNEDIKSLVVHNMLGQNVYAKEGVKASELENGIPLKNTSTGVYLVTLNTKSNSSITKKIIIQ
ncbi:GEVED domain-containing protein [Lacinutrix himadriensis]|uniref:GEVED domain-containing protein n=1 Tax=Lacinutrix himadriensis TaxID=641549 RepID=UPI0006E2B35F|nr:GEVED domain-containing protein [Lacinutrix himadriensis]